MCVSTRSAKDFLCVPPKPNVLEICCSLPYQSVGKESTEIEAVILVKPKNFLPAKW